MTGIVRAGPEDAARLAALHARCFPHGWSERDIAALLRQPAVIGFAAPEGFVLIRRVLDEAEILTICVDPEARRSGLGGGLLDAAISEAARQGALTIHLDVSTENRAGQALYSGRGFAETARRKRYYADGSDAILMTKQITPADPAAGV
ncbi:GNAT family N-acetyltransferase [Hyphobacterium marinum]|uniref:GNAT family N-acetyltransferase n=1 Tax=Hyphobacterium marinum TaxID=3116574 RepID=A0ABU7LV55_9PROT|nr:GNAT family N-acetyltransferase [Hyphobacterium sp. Y6023]MEE2565437.1 GNAT family N-acetyltransferase [Hyphobacterium sp. Y6023]